MKILFEENTLDFNAINHPVCGKMKVRLTIARLDKLHPIVSGNKLFKLHYFLEDAIATGKPILTFGGAYSNHLVATAYAAQHLGIAATGIVRGEQPVEESHTLRLCREYGMKLEYISRDAYKEIQRPESITQIKDKDDFVIIPEGGFHPIGAKGAALIMDKLLSQLPSHVCVAVGTATTLAGLISAATENQKIIGFPVLKNMTDIASRISWLLNKEQPAIDIIGEYHFGGYAKNTKELLHFMNKFYREHQVPLDFVYTAKMVFGTLDKIDSGYFPEGSHIICLHTGGLQGNKSLPNSSLVY